LAGQHFLDNLRHQALRYGAQIRRGQVTQIDRTNNDTFTVSAGAVSLYAAKLIVASGIEDALPDIPEPEKAVRAGLLRLCPICDGYEAIDRKIACLIKPDTIEHALFLRTYTARLTAFIAGEGKRLTAREKQVLQLASIDVVDTDFKIRIDPGHVFIQLNNCETRAFDVLYCLTGSIPQIDFLQRINLQFDRSGKIITDAHQQTSVSGLYAAGDVTVGLCQISVAAAEGATAASHIHSVLETIPAE
jgi:thioredoxin reductase (NADPH)